MKESCFSGFMSKPLKINCAKHVTVCKIVTKSGHTFYGENNCLVEQEECPRLPGEGYEKCKTVCFQVGHAEELAVLKALSHGMDLNGAKAIIGHERICDNCKNLLNAHGITDIEFLGLTK